MPIWSAPPIDAVDLRFVFVIIQRLGERRPIQSRQIRQVSEFWCEFVGGHSMPVGLMIGKHIEVVPEGIVAALC